MDMWNVGKMGVVYLLDYELFGNMLSNLARLPANHHAALGIGSTSRERS